MSYQGQQYGQQYGQQPYNPQQQYGQQQSYDPHQQYQQPSYGNPPPQQQYQQHAPTANSTTALDNGTFAGGSYKTTHRNTNSVLTVTLQPGASIRSIPGAMIHMSASVTLSGNIKFSMKKMFTGSEIRESTYTGPGVVGLAPTLPGDIITLPVDGSGKWKIGKDSWLCCTEGLKRETKSQGFTKTMFSGEDLFVYHVTGSGLAWLTSFGAVEKLDLQHGEQHIIDNGHLVAWNCDYHIERAGGGAGTSFKTGEGMVCRFTGPGTVYYQTRNEAEFANWIRAVAGTQSG